MAKIIELQHGRLKPVRNRLRGNTGKCGKRRCSYDNDIEFKNLRRLEERSVREQIEDCELIGPTGLLRHSPDHVRSSNQCHSSNRCYSSNEHPNRQSLGPNISTASTQVGKSKAMVSAAKRPTFKVFIDENGTMRARPLAAELPMNLYGSPQGYVGYGQTMLMEALRQGPQPVILLDECEHRAL